MAPLSQMMVWVWAALLKLRYDLINQLVIEMTVTDGAVKTKARPRKVADMHSEIITHIIHVSSYTVSQNK